MMTTIESLQAEWKKYRDAIYPKDTSSIQNRETHQAFFAGAFIMTKAMEIAAALPEDDAIKFLVPLIGEAEQVCQNIKAIMEARN